jgi:hypothetical protein
MATILSCGVEFYQDFCKQMLVPHLRVKTYTFATSSAHSATFLGLPFCCNRLYKSNINGLYRIATNAGIDRGSSIRNQQGVIADNWGVIIKY